MDRCWLGETNFDYDHEKHGTKPNATAIQINGNDHYILNTIVFSSKIGLEVNGAADYITGNPSPPPFLEYLGLGRRFLLLTLLIALCVCVAQACTSGSL